MKESDLYDKVFDALKYSGTPSQDLTPDQKAIIKERARKLTNAITEWVTIQEFRVLSLVTDIDCQSIKTTKNLSVSVKAETQMGVWGKFLSFFKTVLSFIGLGGPLNINENIMTKTADKVGQDGATLPKLNLLKTGTYSSQGGQLVVKGVSFIETPNAKTTSTVSGNSKKSVVKLMKSDVSKV